jgi:putative FmdB family regulatory protein
MPLLDFECERCSARFEELVLGDKALVCPECGAAEARRLFSPIGAAPKVSMSRTAMRDSDSRRSEREAARKERFSERRRNGPPTSPS